MGGSSGYHVDDTVHCMKEIDRFFDEQATPTGILSKHRGQILFSLGAYIGQTLIKLYGGEWITDDGDIKGEMHIAVKLSNGSIIWPVLKCMKRYTEGKEDSIYAYIYALTQEIENEKYDGI